MFFKVRGYTGNQSMMKKPEVLSVREVAKTSVFRVETVGLRFSNGQEREYERLGRFNSPVKAVMVVPFLPDGRLVMIKEYAVGVESYITGFPRGLAEAGESLSQGAERELKEEAGFGAKFIEQVAELALSPHYMCHKMNLMLAQDLYKCSLPGDEPEPLSVHYYTWEEAFEVAHHQAYKDVRTIAALYMVRDHLKL